LTLERIARHRSFGGVQEVWRHEACSTGTAMEFSIFLPPQAERERCPVLTWLSGLTCTWANFTEKAGAQRYAAAHGLIVVCPDTSPRGTELPGEHDAYDFGSGAGFYVDASEDPWARHYRMYTYVNEELPALVDAHFPGDGARRGIFGHSMGGHGALISAFRERGRYRSVSAIAPIAAPMDVAWGQKAFAGYLGPNRAAWEAWDASRLAAGSGWSDPILVDQGTGDPFLDSQLRPARLAQACEDAGIALDLRMHDGYDHSYYFIASVIGDHIARHAATLRAA
jgi:S-formylglutathione hydrolase